MPDVKTIFVTGATGNQGGAVAKSLHNNGFSVKALTRNPASLAAQKLKASDIEIIKGDLNDVRSLQNHIQGVDGIFSVQSFEKGTDQEIRQGIALASLAKEHQVKHFIYASVAGADLHTGIPHFESKFIIENHIKQIGLPYTILRPTAFLENFLLPPVKSRILKGKLSSPIDKHVVQQFISVVDIGKISVEIFNHPERTLGKTIMLGVEEMNMQALASIFSEVMGREIKYQKLPMFITRLVMGSDLYKMFKWINENEGGFMKDIPSFREENPTLTTIKQWIKLNFQTEQT